MGIIDQLRIAKSKFLAKDLSVFSGSRQLAPDKNLARTPNWFFSPQLGIPRNVNVQELRNFARAPVVRLCVQAGRRAVNSADWEIVPVDEGEDVADYEQDITFAKEFLEYPNRNGETFGDLWGAYIEDVLELDAGVIIKAKANNGKIAELFAHDGARFLIEINKYGIIQRYLQYSFKTPGQEPLPFDRDQIIYGKANNSTQFFPYGWSPLQSVLQEVEILIQSTRYNKDYFQNNAIPDGIVTVPMQNREQMQRFKDEWRKEIKGKPHKLLFHNVEGANFTPLKLSNKDMEWLSGQQWFQNIVLASYGRSPAELGFADQVNKASQEGQERVGIKQGDIPLLMHIEQKINREVLPELAYSRDYSGGMLPFKFKFKLPDPIKENNEHRKRLELLREGALTINEVRAVEGLPDVEWGDEPMRKPSNNPFQQGQGLGPFHPQQAAGGAGGASIQFPRREEDEEDVEKMFEAKVLESLFEKAMSEEKIGEIYKKYHETVNMSASELESWSKNPCSKGASLSREPINRNLRLLRKKRADWTEADAKSANRTISFVSRMKGAEQGEPVKVDGKTCPSKRDISLKNWAYNPSKGNKGVVEYVEKAVGEHVEQEEAKDYVDMLRKEMDKWEKAIILSLHRNLEKGVVKKGFNEFLVDLFSKVSSEQFRTKLKRVVKKHVSEGVDEAEKEINLDVGLSENNKLQIDVLVDRQVDGFALASGKRWHGLKGMANALQVEVLNTVREGLSEGKGFKGISDDIKEVMAKEAGGTVKGEVTEGRAMRIARTETNRIRNKGRVQAFKDSGLSGKKQWVALHDHATSDVCKRLDGQIVGLDESFIDPDTNISYGEPPSHPNCRAVIRFVSD